MSVFIAKLGAQLHTQIRVSGIMGHCAVVMAMGWIWLPLESYQSLGQGRL